jgi:hypothetical protein
LDMHLLGTYVGNFASQPSVYITFFYR